MLCRNPFVRDKRGNVFFQKDNPRRLYEGIPFGCGKCLACRVKKRRDWTSRLLLEMLEHQHGAFLTLTYDELHVPWNEAGTSRTLSKRDFQLFMKRLRINLERRKKTSYPIRFYACGEYGVNGTQRPHYHIILFGVSDLDYDLITAIHNAWTDKDGLPYGFFRLDPLNAKRVAYVAGYIMKKLIAPRKVYKHLSDGTRVLDRDKSDRDDEGTQAEFRLMSRRPGIASESVKRWIELYQSSPAFRRKLVIDGDVTSVIHHMGQFLFLDRFLKKKLRESLGVEFDPTPYYEEMRAKFFAWRGTLTFKEKIDSHGPTFAEYLVHLDDQKYKQLEARIKRQVQKRGKI